MQWHFPSNDKVNIKDRTMEPILDGNSEHVAHALRKMVFSEKKKTQCMTTLDQIK